VLHDAEKVTETYVDGADPLVFQIAEKLLGVGEQQVLQQQIRSR
jgi:hypothetical protein